MRYPATMRRATGAASSRAVWLLLAASSVAHAAPWVVTAEGGGEADTNVQRVETGPGLTTSRVSAPVGRLGAKLDHRGKLLGGAFAFAASALARVVYQGTTPEDMSRDVAGENVTLLVGDFKWVRPVSDRPVSVGVGVTAADALPLTGGTGSRTFTNIGADGLLVLRGGDERSLTIAVGAKQFIYKPDRRFDWSGPAASVRLDLTLWQPAGGTRSLELAASAGVEARAYESTALANACSEEAPPIDPRDCFSGTSLARHDRYERVGVELTFVGRVVATAGYQLSVTDSNSFGQSLVRHRISASATRALPWRLYGTALATLQIDQYLDGLIARADLENQTFTTLDDESRSSLQLRLARQVSARWSVESRAAIWRNLGNTSDTSSFRRALLYVGAVYNH